MKKTHALLLFLFAACCVCGCKNGQTHTSSFSTGGKLAPLEAGNVSFAGEDPFGKTVELTGEHVIGDGVIFRLGGPQMLIKDSTMVLLADRRFMLFSLPDLKFLGYRGELGEGPDEFNYPQLFPSADNSLLCCLWETTNQKIYGLSNAGEIVPVAFPMQKGGRAFARTFQFNPAPGDYIFTDATPSGREISRATIQEDSTVSVRQIYDLDLDPQWKDRGKFTANNGFLAVNPLRDRMAYAYNYYKILKFMDMEGVLSVRSISAGMFSTGKPSIFPTV